MKSIATALSIFALLLAFSISVQIPSTSSSDNSSGKNSESLDELMKQGKELLDNGNYTGAIPYFDKALETNPEDPHYLNEILNLFTSTQWSKDKTKQVDDFLKTNPSSIGALFTKASMIYANVDNFPRPDYLGALTHVDKILAVNPRNAYSLHFKGILLIYLERYEESVSYNDKLLEIYPSSIYVLTRKAATLYLLLDKPEEALQTIDKILEIDPRDVDVLSQKASLLNNLGRFEEEIHTYDQILDIDPSNLNAVSQKALRLHDLGRTKEAIQAYDKFLEINSGSIEALRGKVYLLSNEEAIQAYDKFLEMNPGNVDALWDKAYLFSSSGRYEEAIQMYDKIYESDPKNTYPLISKGGALLQLGRYDEAMETYDKALEINSNDISALIGKGDVLFKLGRYEEAIVYYGTAAKQPCVFQFGCEIPGAKKKAVLDEINKRDAIIIRVGKNPFAVAVNRYNNKIYVANWSPSTSGLPNTTISVIDGFANKVIETITVGQVPYPILAVNPNTNKIYVIAGSEAYPRPYNLTVIDSLTDNIIDTIPVSGALAINIETNTVYVVDLDRQGVQLYVINSITDKISAKVNLNETRKVYRPFQVAVNQDANRVYIALSTDKANSTGFLTSLTVLDGSTHQLVASNVTAICPPKINPWGCSITGLAVDGITDKLYALSISNENPDLGKPPPLPSTITGTLYITAAHSFDPIAQFTMWYPTGIAVNTYTHRVYVTNAYHDEITVINDVSETMSAPIKVRNEDQPWGIAVNQDNNIIYISNRLSNSVIMIDGFTHRLVIPEFPINLMLITALGLLGVLVAVRLKKQEGN